MHPCKALVCPILLENQQEVGLAGGGVAWGWGWPDLEVLSASMGPAPAASAHSAMPRWAAWAAIPMSWMTCSAADCVAGCARFHSGLPLHKGQQYIRCGWSATFATAAVRKQAHSSV